MISKKENLISFLILMSVGIFLSVLLKNEIVYDLANYHYYNVFAFLNDRSNSDVVPAAIQTFFNPIADLPLYFNIKYFNDSPNIFYALQGIWCGLFLFVLYKICLLFFPENKKYLFSCLVLILSITAQATFCQIGTCSNEITVSFFILWGFYLLLIMIKTPKIQSLKTFFIAGLIMGIGLGLKQTVITYCISSGLTLIICSKYLNKPIKSIFLFALGGLLGYLIFNGYFMYKYWHLFGNPFFPFLNGIFHSPYYLDLNYRDVTFIPPFKKFFIFPFLWNIKPRSISEVPYRDLRLTLYYILPIFVFFILFFKAKIKTFFLNEKLLTTAYIFNFLSLIIWMAVFSIMRYSIVIEAIGAIQLIKLFVFIKNKFAHLFLSVLIFGLIISIFFYGSFGHIYYKHIHLQKITLPENTLVKIYGIPTSFIIPIVAEKQNIKSITYSYLTENKLFSEKIDQIKTEHQGVVVYIYDKENFDVFKTKEQLEQEYANNLKLCRHAVSLGWIKNINQCVCGQSYKHGMQITEDTNKYTCKKLENNLNSNLVICVPTELKAEIFGSNY